MVINSIFSEVTLWYSKVVCWKLHQTEFDDFPVFPANQTSMFDGNFSASHV